MNYELIDKEYTYKEQDPKYQGERIDTQLAEGPTDQRTCRDCLCFILYIALWVAMLVVACYAWKNGNPQLLAAPFDSTGQQCGYGASKDYPFAYYNLKNLSEFGCIKNCPSNSQEQFQTMLGGQVYSNSRFEAYQTIQMVSLCFPVSQQINQYISTGLSYYDMMANDLKATWKISLISVFAALMLSVVLLAFIRTCGSCIVIIVIFLYLLALVGLGFGCLVVSNDGIEGFEEYSEYTNPEMLKAAAYCCWILAGFSLIALCCSIKKIRIAAAVIRSAAEFTRQQCKVILVPLLMFLAISAFFVFWLFASIYIFSCGEIKQCAKSPYACIQWEVGVKRSLSLFLFGLFWNCEVAIAICQFVIASTAAYWYFSHLKKSNFPLSRSFCRALTYQLGSLVFGALILCIMWILQILLEILHHFAKNQSLSGNPANNICSDYIIRCARCCLACFQRFVRFVTTNAFLMMAISGEGFCTAAHQAFYLALRSSGQYAITHGVGHTLMFFSKLLVSVLVTSFGYLLAIGLQQFNEAIYTPLTPAIMCFIISYVIGSFFMDVFAVASDTILLCYSLQVDIRKGMAIACPPELKDTLQYNRK